MSLGDEHITRAARAICEMRAHTVDLAAVPCGICQQFARAALGAVGDVIPPSPAEAARKRIAKEQEICQRVSRDENRSLYSRDMAAMQGWALGLALEILDAESARGVVLPESPETITKGD